MSIENLYVPEKVGNQRVIALRARQRTNVTIFTHIALRPCGRFEGIRRVPSARRIGWSFYWGGFRHGSFCTYFGFTATTDCAAWAQAWGGWAQAIGAMLAIYASFRVANAQHVRDEKRREEDRYEAEVRVRGIATMFGERVFAAIREMQRGCNNSSQVTFAHGKMNMDDVLDWGRKIELSALHPGGALAIANIRALAIEANSPYIDAQVDFNKKFVMLEEIAKRVHRYRQDLVDTYPHLVELQARLASNGEGTH